MSEETYAAVLGAAVGVVLGVALTPVVERVRRKIQVRALRALLHEHFLATVGVIAQKRELVKAISDGFKLGGSPEGFNVPFPVEAVQRVDLALAEDLSVQDRHVVANVLALLVIVDEGIAAGLSTDGNNLPARQAAVTKVGHCTRALDSAERLVTNFLQGQTVDVTRLGESAKRFPGRTAAPSSRYVAVAAVLVLLAGGGLYVAYLRGAHRIETQANCLRIYDSLGRGEPIQADQWLLESGWTAADIALVNIWLDCDQLTVDRNRHQRAELIIQGKPPKPDFENPWRSKVEGLRKEFLEEGPRLAAEYARTTGP